MYYCLGLQSRKSGDQLQSALLPTNLTAIATIRLWPCSPSPSSPPSFLPSPATRDAPLTTYSVSPSLSSSPRFSLPSSSTSLRLRAAAAAATSERIAASEFVNGARFLALSLPLWSLPAPASTKLPSQVVDQAGLVVHIMAVFGSKPYYVFQDFAEVAFSIQFLSEEALEVFFTLSSVHCGWVRQFYSRYF